MSAHPPHSRRWLAAALAAAALALPMGAAERMPAVGSIDTSGDDLPSPLLEVGFDQRLGEELPLGIELIDESGQARTLGELVADKPVILVPAYYECPMLCTMVINDLTTALKVVPLELGGDFDIVIYSIDPEETPEMALAAKNTAVGRYDGGDGAGWTFATGDQEAISALSEAIGFRYYYDEKSGEYAHTAGLVVVTPDGKIARYFFGLEYPPRELRLALVDAADEKIGSLADKLYLYCFQWDPTTGQYSAITMNIVRLGAALTVLGLVFMVSLMIWRERGRPANSLGTT